MKTFLSKLSFFFYRIGESIWNLFRRIIRLIKHFSQLTQIGKGTEYYKGASYFTKLNFWFLEWVLLGLDLLGLPDWYESFADLFKYKTRRLSEEELKLGQSIFGRSINWERVRIDEKSYIGPKQQRFIYVSFYTINSYGPMPLETLVHELVHVWQYQKFGVVYIPRALYAQRTEEGYNYGGATALRNPSAKARGMQHFNFEQQGDIIMDYFLISQQKRPKWGSGTSLDLDIYKIYATEVFE